MNLLALPSHNLRDCSWILVPVNQFKNSFYLFDERDVNDIPHAPRQDDLFKKVKLESADFSRQFDSRAFLDWVTSLEDYLNKYPIKDPRRVTIVKMKLKGPTKIWRKILMTTMEIWAACLSPDEKLWRKDWRTNIFHLTKLTHSKESSSIFSTIPCHRWIHS